MKNFENFRNNHERDQVQTVSIDVPNEVKRLYPEFEYIDSMPKGCAIIGGAARSLAFSMVRRDLHDPIPIRDIDVAYFKGEVDPLIVNEYARMFSPDDYVHGHGAQLIESIDDYMQSRDFTMNQVIYSDGQLIASRSAIRDIYRGVISPCDNRFKEDWYDGSYFENNYISTRTALKAVLQQTVLSEFIPDIRINNRVANRRFSLSSITSDDYWYDDRDDRYNGFQLALAIQKSFEYGDQIPQKFIKNIIDSPIFENESDILIDEKGNPRRVYDIMNDINDYILGFNPFIYRNQAQDYLSEISDEELQKRIDSWAQIEDLYMRDGRNFRGNIKL